VKFKRVPEKVWEALVQSQLRFNRVPGRLGAKPSQVQRVPEKVPKAWEALVQSQVRFNRSGEGSREGLGGSGAEPGQVQHVWRRFQRRSGRLWCRARSGSTGFRRRFRRRLQKPSQFRFIQLTENQLRCFQRLASQHGCKKNKTLRLLGIPLKLIWYQPSPRLFCYGIDIISIRAQRPHCHRHLAATPCNDTSTQAS